MSENTRSCLVENFAYYIDIDPDTEELIASLEKDERSYRRHQLVYEAGNDLTNLYAIKKGWFYAYTDLPDGRRQIVQILHPGDIVGFPDVAFSKTTTSVCAAEAGVLCPFPKSRLETILWKSPKLTAALFSIANCDYARVINALRATGRMDARERIAYFLLANAARLKITNRAMTNSFRLPLNQNEIGDALGLTHTYVSKTIRDMETDGLISRSGNVVTFEREDALRALAEFEDHYAMIDTRWYPG